VPSRSKSPVKAADDRRERIKLTINNAFDEAQRERSLASLRRKREREKLRLAGVQQPRDKVMREVIIPEVITIQELANRMTERSVDVIKLLMAQGEMHKINDVIDADTAELIVTEFGHTPKRVSEADVEEGFIGQVDTEEHLESRPPVVTIMGHVDHGKTSLLDAIRKTNVVSGEAGGITQHIGAYQVTTPAGEKITFIDTPGHEAFTAMRARGAKVTDIVVLVVAADDGVMPQTVEAINHAKAGGVPLIVAINKMDKPDADPQRVRLDLLQHEVVVESMSGETLEVPVSALKQTGLDKLLEAIHLQAELLDLKANPNRSADGVVIEAKLERGRGPVGTVLVQRGTLRVGDIVVAGMAWGRAARADRRSREPVPEAGHLYPVEILGFDSAPGSRRPVCRRRERGRAREITDYRVRKRRQTLGRCRLRPYARADDATAQGSRAQGIPARHQGRRAGLGGSHHGRAEEARHGRGRGAHHPFRRRRHNGVRHRAGELLRGRGDRVQRACERAGQGSWRTNRASRSATTTSSTIWWTT
jgi:translation initiation factor IF-2